MRHTGISHGGKTAGEGGGTREEGRMRSRGGGRGTESAALPRAKIVGDCIFDECLDAKGDGKRERSLHLDTKASLLLHARKVAAPTSQVMGRGLSRARDEKEEKGNDDPDDDGCDDEAEKSPVYGNFCAPGPAEHAME